MFSVNWGKHLRPTGAAALSGRCGLIVGLGVLLVLFLSQAAEALDGRRGRYVFNDAETGKAITVWYAKPDSFSADAPIVMVLHGQNRNAKNYRDAWKGHADRHGFLLLAPEFSEELFPGNQYEHGNYFAATPAQAEKNKTFPQKNHSDYWSFRVPDKIFTDFGAHRETTNRRTYYIYGHSAGAQFVHRMLAVVPETKVQMAVAANAGRYTLPDADESWPYGLKEAAATSAEIRKFLAAPLVILVGENDTDSEHPGLRRTKKADRQGLNRLERGRYFYDFGSALAKSLGVPFGWRFQIVPGAAHSNKAMAEAAADLIAQDVSANK